MSDLPVRPERDREPGRGAPTPRRTGGGIGTRARRAVVALAAALLTPAAPAQESDRAATYTPSAENLAARRWFTDARFGVFLHWGLYSELGGGGDRGVAEWIMENRKIPAARYERLAEFFNPVRFDADAWVSAVKAAGARYIVITAKHHDGFAMFGSRTSPYNVVAATPFRRDPMAELAVACRKAGVKLFFYYSQLDWHHPGYFPLGRTGHAAGRAPGGDWESYLQFQDAQLTELLTRYGPIGGIWFDGWWDQAKTPMRDRWQLARTYRLIHRLQPAAMIVNNHHVAPFAGEDYQAFEQDLPGENRSGYNDAAVSALPLEMAETMNGSWGFNLVDDDFKSPATLIRTLAGAAGRGANLLLNTGPMPDGRLQPENVATLAAIGRWLKVNGQSIHGTTAGPIPPQPWGVTTRAGRRVFVHLLRDPGSSLALRIRGVRSARLLDGDAPVRVRATGEGTLLTGLERPADAADQVVVLQLADDA